jgi:hypothetical protein
LRKRTLVPVPCYYNHCSSTPRLHPYDDRLQLTISAMQKR